MESEEPSAEIRHGGIAFFTGLVFWILAACLSISCISIPDDAVVDVPISFVIIGMVLGVLLGSFLVRGYIKSAIHEVKHCIAAVLVGNKIEKFSLGHEEGHVTYAYTDDKRKFNAIICIAPYVIPLFTLLAVLVVLIAGSLEHRYKVLLVCLAFGFDLFANIRDVSPVQTDFTTLRGGFFVGVLFTCFSNLFSLSLVLSWSFGQWQGALDTLACSWSKLVVLAHF